MTEEDNRRETGGRVPKTKTGPDPANTVSSEAAENRKPPLGVGLSERVYDANEKTRHSDGQAPRRPPARR